MQCYIDFDVFLLQDNQYQFFQWCDPKLCQRAKVVINNLTKENKQLQNVLNRSLKRSLPSPIFPYKLMDVDGKENIHLEFSRGA